MTSVLILGDPHIGAGSSIAKNIVGSSVNSRIVDQIHLLDWVLDRAVENNVSHLVITGDVFEEPKPHYTLVSILIDWLTKCSGYGLNVHIIAGNHDILRSGQVTTSPLDIVSSCDIPNVYVYKKIHTIHLDDIGITLLPFRDRRSFNTDVNGEALETLRSQIAYEQVSIDDLNTKLLIGHLTLEGAIPVGYELGDLANELQCSFDMFKNYDYVWMGHVHKFQVLSEKPYISHIGSMDISNFGEKDQDKFIAILDTKKETKLKYLKLPTRRLNHISITVPEGCKDPTEFVQQFILNEEDLKNCIIKISVIMPPTIASSVDRSLIEQTAYSAGAFHITRISEERKFNTLKKVKDDIDNTVNEFSAIKSYSSTLEEVYRSEFVELASNIVQEYKENIK